MPSFAHALAPRLLVALLAGAAAGAAAGAPAKPSAAVKSDAAAKPTVVLITLDTTRADRLGCYGRKGAATPNLDSLAASGARFAEAWAAAPITLPSHLTMLTGCYPVTHGVRDNGVSRFDGKLPTLAARFAAAGYRTAAVVSASVLEASWGANAGFAVYDDRLGDKDERGAAATTQRALEIVRAAGGPLFLWVHYFDAHWPYEPPPPFAARFAADPYQGEIAAVDAEVGRLLAGLTAAGRKPLVVVAGDHGEGLGEHGERTHGIFTYRSTLRVPFLIAGPGVPAGRVIADPVSLADLAPTVAELAGLPKAATQDGVSLAAAVRGAAATPSREIWFESMLPFDSYGWVPPTGFRDGRYAYIDLPRRELYDLRADPDQKTNLYRADDAVSQRLAARGDALRAELDARAGHGDAVTLSEEDRARLASLGYLSGYAPASATPTLDPKDVIDLADRVDQAKELHERGRDDEAIAVADAILKRNPDNVPALSVRGQALLALRRYRESTAAFGAALERSPSSAVHRFDLGAALAGAGETARAEAEWRRAIELDPRFAEPRASLIASRREHGDTAGAQALAKEAAASGAESAELSFEIGLTAAVAGDLDAARRWFESAVRLRPSHAQALGNLGRIAYQQGRIDDALARYRAAAAAAPAEPEFPKRIGAILWNDRNDPAGALAAFRAALAVEREPGEREALAATIAELERETAP